MADKVYLTVRARHTYTLTPCGMDHAYAASSTFHISDVNYPKTDADVELLESSTENAGELKKVKDGVATLVVNATHRILIRPDDDQKCRRIVDKIAFFGDFGDEAAKEAGIVVNVVKSQIIDVTVDDAK